MTHSVDTIQYMQQQCYYLGTLCNHVDIKASIFLSLVTAMLLAYAFSPVANLITLAAAVAYTAAVPMRIGVHLLGTRNVAVGAIVSHTGRELLSMPATDQKAQYVRTANALRRAIDHNGRLLHTKQSQHWSIMVISLCMFGFIMAMTAVGTFIEPPAWSVYQPR